MMTEGEYTPDRVRAEPNAAPVTIFAATGLNFVITSERRIDPSFLNIVLYDSKIFKGTFAGWKTGA
jgi:hypothetical protein